MLIPVDNLHERQARTPTKVRLEARRIFRSAGESRRSDGENVEWTLAQIVVYACGKHPSGDVNLAPNIANER